MSDDKGNMSPNSPSQPPPLDLRGTPVRVLARIPDVQARSISDKSVALAFEGIKSKLWRRSPRMTLTLLASVAIVSLMVLVHQNNSVEEGPDPSWTPEVTPGEEMIGGQVDDLGTPVELFHQIQPEKKNRNLAAEEKSYQEDAAKSDSDPPAFSEVKRRADFLPWRRDQPARNPDRTEDRFSESSTGLPEPAKHEYPNTQNYDRRSGSDSAPREELGQRNQPYRDARTDRAIFGPLSDSPRYQGHSFNLRIDDQAQRPSRNSTYR